jgi:sugar phosphate isomerase/epimerase
MRISFGTWAFSFGPYAGRPVPLPEVARQLAAAGYDGIELCGFPPHVTLDAYASTAARAELRVLLSGLGLGVSGFAADFTTVNPTAHSSRARYLELFRRNLDLAAALGSPTLRVDTVAAPGSIPDEEYHLASHRLADTWRECAELARQAGVRMVWEFEPGFVFNKPSEVVSLHELVGHAFFQVLFDTSHAYMAAVVGARQHGKRETLEGGVAEFLDQLKGSIGAIHVVDSDGTLHGDETSTHTPFGAGHIHFESLVPQLLAEPHIDWWCIDLCFQPEVERLLAPSLATVRRLLAQAKAA